MNIYFFFSTLDKKFTSFLLLSPAVTAFHLSQPLLIGYGVFWLIVAPSGLWGIFGSTQVCIYISKFGQDDLQFFFLRVKIFFFFFFYIE
jgi:hypothetical protein